MYPTDLDHPRVHVVWVRTITMGTGKVVLVAAYKTYPGYLSGPEGAKETNKALASVTVSTYDDASKPNNYTGAILAEQTFKHREMVEAEVRAVNWLTELQRGADWGAK